VQRTVRPEPVRERTSTARDAVAIQPCARSCGLVAAMLRALAHHSGKSVAATAVTWGLDPWPDDD
jgi:hypothetical protein